MSGGGLKEESNCNFRALNQHMSEVRKQHGMTQAGLARVLGVSQRTVFAYEGERRVSVPRLPKLAENFAIAVETLDGDDHGPRGRLTAAYHRRVFRYAEHYRALRKSEQRFMEKCLHVLFKISVAEPSS